MSPRVVESGYSASAGFWALYDLLVPPGRHCCNTPVQPLHVRLRTPFGDKRYRVIV